MRINRLLLPIALVAAPVSAGNTLVADGVRVAVARSPLTVQPAREWNRMGARPGRNSESWTIDGDELNELNFYGGIETGRPLFRQVDKRNKPLPLFSSTMLATDIPTLFENSYRIALGTALMTVEDIAPATLAGHKGVRFTYRFTRQDEEVRRRGEAIGAIIDRRLYLVSFEAPILHYYDAGAPAARAVIESASLTLPAAPLPR